MKAKNISQCKLVVGNIPMEITERQLQEAFEKVGVVASIVILLDQKTGRRRGFAIVEMETMAQADEAVKMLDRSTLAGRQIAVNRSEP